MERPTNTATDTDIQTDIMDIVQMTLGQYLKKHRQITDWTMKEVCDLINCDISYLSKIENDHITPTWEMVETLAGLYGISKISTSALAWKQLEVSRNSQLRMAMSFWTAAS